MSKKERDRAYYEKHKESIKAKNKAKYAANKEPILKRSRDWKQRNPFWWRAKNLQSLYGISLEQFDEMSKAQDDACKICKTKTKLVVDHCHDSGMIRGLLCDGCNKGIGFLKDNPELVYEASVYLTPALSL